MKQLMTLVACWAVVGGLGLPASAQTNCYGQPPFQYPGAPGSRGQGVTPRQEEKDRDQRNGLGGAPHIPHLHMPSGETEPHPPKWTPPETVVPTPEFKYSPPKFTLYASEGGAVIPRGISGWRTSGILTGIGGAIAALFGGLFGRKKES